MKKVICLLMIFALSGALYAADVNFGVVQQVDPAKVKISYGVVTGNTPTGIALKVSINNGVKITGSEAQSANFNVNPDFAYEDPCNYTVGLGHPLAEPCAPGVAPLPSSEVSICMGIVDPCDSHGPAADDIITLTLDPCGAIVATLTLSEDAYRGGVVGSPLNTNLPIDIPIAFEVCDFPTGHDDYAAWQAAGSPFCWCYTRQCHGDTDGVFEGKDVDGQRRYVVLADLTLLGAAWQKVDDLTWNTAWQCANSDHGFEGKDLDGQRRYVTLPDLNILGGTWQDTDDLIPADCLD